MPAEVLDSFALVAYFRGEPGAEMVKALLQKAAATERPLLMTEVNYTEAKYIVIRKDGPRAWEEAAAILPTLPIAFHPVTRSLADAAADIKSRHRLSLGDAFCAALAKEQKAELVTGDPEFKQLAGEIKIRWLRANHP